MEYLSSFLLARAHTPDFFVQSENQPFFIFFAVGLFHFILLFMFDNWYGNFLLIYWRTGVNILKTSREVIKNPGLIFLIFNSTSRTSILEF